MCYIEWIHTPDNRVDLHLAFIDVCYTGKQYTAHYKFGITG